MKILLVGEFSRLHNSLKEGLLALGHEVTLVGNGDQFKKYPVDHSIDSFVFNKGIPLFFRKVVLKLLSIDIADFEIVYRFKKLLPQLKGYDVVQLINEDALAIHPKLQIPLLQKLIDQNKSVFLLCCGDDPITVNFANNGQYRYSFLTPYLTGKVSTNYFAYSLKYLTAPYKKLHEFLKGHIRGVIATDMDYHLPMLSHNNYLGLIPNPINIDRLKFIEPHVSDQIIIFHGVNNMNYYKKGNDIFEAALDILNQKHSKGIEIITARSLPYDAYIKSYNRAHIVLDQVYAYDQGYNALEAMAKGKVVFTGAEQEWLDYYRLEEDTVAINALPDAEKIAEKLEWLVLNPEKILEISKNARAFIEREHHYVRVAERYVEKWGAS